MNIQIMNTIRVVFIVFTSFIALVGVVFWIDSYRQLPQLGSSNNIMDCFCGVAECPQKIRKTVRRTICSFGKASHISVYTEKGNIVIYFVSFLKKDTMINPMEWHLLSFSYKLQSWDNFRRYQSISVPIWCFCFFFGVYPAAIFVKGRAARWSRRRRGRCTECGYCIKGLSIPRCPECGTPFGKLLFCESVLVNEFRKD